MRVRPMLLIFAVVLIGAYALIVQTQPRDSQDSEVPKLVSELQANDWRIRAAALERLTAENLKSERVKNALIELLDKENQLADSTLRESRGREGVSVKYGEEYSEYYSTLFGMVAEFDDDRALKVLAGGSYNSDSVFAKKLATRWEVVGPVIVALARSDIAARQETAAATLTEILKVPQFEPDYGGGTRAAILAFESPNTQRYLAAEWNTKLNTRWSTVACSPEFKSTAIRTVKQVWSETASESLPRILEPIAFAEEAKARAQDEIRARIQTVRVLFLTGDKNSIPLLERIATSNPSSPVSAEAQKAIAALRKAIGSRAP